MQWRTCVRKAPDARAAAHAGAGARPRCGRTWRHIRAGAPPGRSAHQLLSARCRSVAAQVLASVFGPREVELRSQMRHDRAIVKCEYAMAAFSTGAFARGARGFECRGPALIALERGLVARPLRAAGGHAGQRVRAPAGAAEMRRASLIPGPPVAPFPTQASGGGAARRTGAARSCRW